eukprot:TRINITY_DN201_c0_g3_i1.p1 TRINITY_DN201_c0_g3~~TRINITY_DN201_c0_g3_i1.p1  ORF type:complete len:494 (+),score=274.90 TRINITY_DN201_c0_g3_i1:78-1559(+)
MNNKLFISLILSLFLVFVFSAPNTNSVDESDVLVLNKGNIDEVIKNNEHLLIEFYAPWCGHCKSLTPHWAKAATQLKGSAALGKVDCTIETELAKRFGVSGFPTIFYFNKGQQSKYNGGRTADAIVSWLRKKVQPVVRSISNVEEVQQLISNPSETTVIGYFNNEMNNHFIKIANDEIFEAVSFVSISNEVAQSLNFEVDTIKVYSSNNNNNNNNNNNQFLAINSNVEALEVYRFIVSQSSPLVVNIDQSSFMLLAKTKLPFILLFSKQANKQSLIEQANTWANSFKNRLFFGWVDADAFAGAAEQMGGSGRLPAVIAVVDAFKSKFIAFDETKELNDENVNAWLETVIEGKAKGWRKSQPVPTPNDDPVTVVVGSTFEDIVFDKTKDVLLEFYAPWCGHCKSLVPIYDELGLQLKSVKSIVIAKIDATANGYSSNVEVQGYPTILFFPANNKDTPITFSGDRTVDGFIKFLKENAAISFNLEDVNETDKDEL